MIHKFLLTCLVLFFAFSGRTFAQDSIPVSGLDGRVNVVNTAVPFLRISPDARSGAMGDAGVAISPDANAIFWNLSKLPFAEEEGAISATYTPWLTQLVNDVFLGTVSGYKKLDDQQAIAASLRYFSLGSVQFTDIGGNPTSQFNPREFAVDAGYSRKLSDNWGVGITLRYIYSNLASGQYQGGETFKAGQAVAGDISFFYTNHFDYDNGGSGTWSFGAAITNIGEKISYTTDGSEKNFLPTNLGLGGAFTSQIDELNKITFTLDLNKLLVPTPPVNPTDSAMKAYTNISVVDGIFKSFGDAPGGFKDELQEVTYSLGIEYWYNNLLAIRGGYFHENKYKGDRQYFTAGLGVIYNNFGLNFSYLVPSGSGIERNPLSNTFRISLMFNLGQQAQ
jgi:hypothetical protein